MKVIHWECYPDLFSDDLLSSSRIHLAMGPKKSIRDNSTTGYYFRWHTRLEGLKGVFVNLVAEDEYPGIDVNALSVPVLEATLILSIDEFQSLFRRLLLQKNQNPIEISFDYSSTDLESFLEKLRTG